MISNPGVFDIEFQSIFGHDLNLFFVLKFYLVFLDILMY